MRGRRWASKPIDEPSTAAELPARTWLGVGVGVGGGRVGVRVKGEGQLLGFKLRIGLGLQL